MDNIKLANCIGSAISACWSAPDYLYVIKNVKRNQHGCRWISKSTVSSSLYLFKLWHHIWPPANLLNAYFPRPRQPHIAIKSVWPLLSGNGSLHKTCNRLECLQNTATLKKLASKNLEVWQKKHIRDFDATVAVRASSALSSDNLSAMVWFCFSIYGLEIDTIFETIL